MKSNSSLTERWTRPWLRSAYRETRRIKSSWSTIRASSTRTAKSFNCHRLSCLRLKIKTRWTWMSYQWLRCCKRSNYSVQRAMSWNSQAIMRLRASSRPLMSLRGASSNLPKRAISRSLFQSFPICIRRPTVALWSMIVVTMVSSLTWLHAVTKWSRSLIIFYHTKKGKMGHTSLEICRSDLVSTQIHSLLKRSPVRVSSSSDPK